MIRLADIREWRTQTLLDSGGNKIGTLESVYVDTRTDEAAMTTARIGMPTRHRSTFVPLDGATAGPGYVRVAHDKVLVKHCPAIGTDDVLPAEDEEAVFRHYGLDYRSGTGGERRIARR